MQLMPKFSLSFWNFLMLKCSGAATRGEGGDQPPSQSFVTFFLSFGPFFFSLFLYLEICSFFLRFVPRFWKSLFLKNLAPLWLKSCGRPWKCFSFLNFYGQIQSNKWNLCKRGDFNKLRTYIAPFKNVLNIKINVTNFFYSFILNV